MKFGGIFYLRTSVAAAGDDGAEQSRLFQDGRSYACRTRRQARLDYSWEVEHPFSGEYSILPRRKFSIAACSQRTKRMLWAMASAYAAEIITRARSRRIATLDLVSNGTAPRSNSARGVALSC